MSAETNNGNAEGYGTLNLDTFGLDAAGAGLAVLPLAEIVQVPEWQPRDGTDAGAIKRYASAYENGEEMPALDVARVILGGQQQFALIDGWHRVEALESLGRARAECRVRPGVLEEAQAAWEAARANLRHGVPLKARERRAAFRAYVRAKQHRRSGAPRRGSSFPLGHRKSPAFKSYREMAVELGGISHNTIRNWMREDHPGVARAMAGEEGGRMGWSGDAHPEPSGNAPALVGAEASIANEAVEALEKAGEVLRIVREPVEKRRIAREVFALAAALEAEGYGAAEMAALEEAPDF